MDVSHASARSIHEGMSSVSPSCAVSVRVSVRQPKTSQDDPIRQQADSLVLSTISAESPVISRPKFRLHTAWFFGGTIRVAT